MEFQDKVVVVTGAAGIFGAWITAAFAREGARLCLSDRRPEALEALVAELGLASDRVLLHPTELTDAASIEDLAQRVTARWNAADIVVNNAGVYPKGGLLDLPVEEWDRIMDTNLRAPFLVSRCMARRMIEAGIGGSIVNIGSGAARQMRNNVVPYCTSKTALERLTKGLALEFAPHKIRVNLVEPGFAPGSVVSPLSEEHVSSMRRRIPLARTSGPEDAPGAILYLCSSRASFITGTVLSVDGGNSIGTYEPTPAAG